eukprot:TRINITY_DN28229_c0_g1_i1.p1 TRINITY_DN28229_c0_g1~~TRINITY_DN28229_c0_g1_i1.p1  ORF type:complete len:380 (+),score=70.02 TRINITY_DN28229_c0_g1_i1:92-1231(+)
MPSDAANYANRRLFFPARASTASPASRFRSAAHARAVAQSCGRFARARARASAMSGGAALGGASDGGNAAIANSPPGAIGSPAPRTPPRGASASRGGYAAGGGGLGGANAGLGVEDRSPARCLKTPWAPFRPGDAGAAAAIGPARAFRVGSLSGHLCSVMARPAWLVQDLKVAVEKLTGVAFREQRLLAGTKELLDSDSVTSVSCLDLTLVRRPREEAALLERVELTSSSLPEDLETIDVSTRRHLVLDIVRANCHALACAPQSWRRDPEVVAAAVRRWPHVFAHAAEELKANREFVLSVMQGENHVELLLSDPWQVLQAARSIFSFLPPELKRDPEICRAAGVDQDESEEELPAGRGLAMSPRSRSRSRHLPSDCSEE